MTKGKFWYSPSRNLWLTLVKLEEGRPLAGWVVNGAWYWVRIKGKEHCLYQEYSTNPITSYEEMIDDWYQTEEGDE